MPKPPGPGFCGNAPGPTSYPGVDEENCQPFCQDQLQYLNDVFGNCLEGGGFCVWLNYKIAFVMYSSTAGFCWFGFTLVYTTCAKDPAAAESYVNDYPRKILYDYGLFGGLGAFVRMFRTPEGVPVFRYANKDTPTNIHIKLDPKYFLP